MLMTIETSYGLAPEYITSVKKIKESKYSPKEGRAAKDTVSSSPVETCHKKGKRQQNVCVIERNLTEGARGPGGVSRGMRKGSVEEELQNPKNMHENAI